MTTQLDIFAHRFGDETVKTRLRADDEQNSLGEAGLKMLDAIQTVVDVLQGENNGYRVGFYPTTSAMTDHKQRRINISGLPLLDAKPGALYRDIAAVLTGFAVHEVGHTRKYGIIDAVRAEWPNKMLPKTLGNIIEDVVLEARTIERYKGFTNVFDAAFEWVAEKTCPKYPLGWKGSSGHKVNFAGQVVRYRPYTEYLGDPDTQRALRWWEEWSARITAKTTPKDAVELVREALLFISEPDGGEAEPPKEKPPTGSGGTQQGLPDEEDEDEGEPQPGEGKGKPSDEDEDPTDGGGGDSEDEDEDDDTEGDSGDGDDDSDEDEDEDGGGTEGDDDDDDSPPSGQPGDDESDGGSGVADTTNRIDLGSKTNDGPGSGGSGQGVGQSSDDDGSDPADFDENELRQEFDALADSRPQDYTLQAAVDTETVTTRINAGQFGKLRVIWK